MLRKRNGDEKMIYLLLIFAADATAAATAFYEQHDEMVRNDDNSWHRNPESAAKELAAAVGPYNVGPSNPIGTFTEQQDEKKKFNGDDSKIHYTGVPGTPGTDYPNLQRIPVTSFSCVDREPGGYYADVETGCQVFHVCNIGGVKSSFLCPPGSIFDQRYFVCDLWYGFNCEEAANDCLSESENSEKKKKKKKMTKNTNDDDERKSLLASGIQNNNDKNSIKDPSFPVLKISNDFTNDDFKTNKFFFNFSPKIHENETIKIDGNPRGFSHRRIESSEMKRKFDESNNFQDSINDLALDVNRVYYSQ